MKFKQKGLMVAGVLFSILIVIGAYAAVSHSFSEIGRPSGCLKNQALTWTGSSWSCVSLDGFETSSISWAVDSVGHDINSIGAPSGCATNQILQWAGSSWQCINADLDGDGDIGEAFGGSDCNDLNIGISSSATEICENGIDEDCSGADLSCDDYDNDGDGYTENEGDCNDAATGINPGETDICENGIDEDCSGSDAVCISPDEDEDGYTIAEGDCDDTSSEINPGETDICNNGIDEDCSGSDAICSLYTWIDCGDEMVFDCPVTSMNCIDICGAHGYKNYPTNGCNEVANNAYCDRDGSLWYSEGDCEIKGASIQYEACCCVV